MKPLMTRDPQGRETRFDYAPNGIDLTQVRQKTEKGFDTLLQVTWNDQHRPLTVKNAAGNLTAYTYNNAGQIASRSNAQGEATKYQYDAKGRLTTVTNALGHIHARYTWDAHGNLASETDSTGITLKHQYDALDRLTQTTWPDGTTTEYTWDKLDRVKVKDRNGKITTEHYDAVRNRIKTTDALRTIQYRYDASGRLVSLTDSKGNTTQWQRDLQGRITSKITPDGTKTAYTYDTTGRERTRTDALGQTRILTYGKDDNLIRITYDKAKNPTPEVRLSWDAAYPRLTSITDGNGSTRYTYGPVGKPGALQRISEQTPFGDKLEDTYALSGQLQSRKLGAAIERMTYDPLGRVSAIENNLLGTFAYNYLGDTPRITQSALTGTPIQHQRAYALDTGDHSLKEITHSGAARNYAHNIAPENLITGITETDQNQKKTWAYQYDAVDRLEIAQDGKQTYRYVLDTANNLSAIETPEGTRTYTSGRDNRIAQAPYKFDANGNRTEDETRTYQWDAENRLIAIGYKKAPGKRTEFKYDGKHRRIAIIEIDDKGRTETRYTWCGDKICRTTDGKGNPIAYYFDEGNARPTKEGQNQRNYYAKDHLGSIRDILDGKGNATARYDYDPYGKLTNESASKPEFGYAGMQYHAPSGLYLTKYRAYDPETGRWLSRDPIEEAGGINLYGYVKGNPVSFIDPLGLMATEAGLITCPAGGPANPACSVSIVLTACKWIVVGIGVILVSGDEEECKNCTGQVSTPADGTGTAGSKSDSEEADRLSKGHRAAREAAKNAGTDARTDPRYGGNCTPDEFDKLSRKQTEICGDHHGGPVGFNSTAERLGGCKEGRHKDGTLMTLGQLTVKRDAWWNCAKARDEVAERCFAGGNKGHRDAINDALKAVANCEELMQ